MQHCLPHRFPYFLQLPRCHFDLFSGLAPDVDNTPVDSLPILVLPAVEECIPILLGHLQDGSGFSLVRYHPSFGVCIGKLVLGVS